MTAAPSETFAALELPGVRHAFLCRVPGVDVAGVERAEALRRLDESHAEARRELGFGAMPPATAQQVHGNIVAIASDVGAPAEGADGLVTATRGVALGIYVADCCAIYFVDPVRRVIGLAHSGKKGTDLGIAAVAIRKMADSFGSRPADIIAQLSPCIRPPHYEIDFAARIAEQCRECGVQQVFDCGRDTAADLSRYYSYRAEHGKTGRMLALLALD